MRQLLHSAKTYGWLALVCLILLLPAVAKAEKIEEFSVTYTIEPSGVVRVEEVIAYDFGPLKRRGIVRTLSSKSAQPASVWYKSRSVPITVLSVLRNGRPEEYRVSSRSTGKDVRIGNPDETITGLQLYTIRYALQGALASGPEGAEFYWNVTGNDWLVPIELVQAEVRVPQGAMVPTRACYYGVYGSESRCESVAFAADRAQFVAYDIQPQAGVTIGQAVKPSIVSVTPYESIAWWVYLPLFGLLLAAVWARRIYIHLVKHRPNRAIIAEYEPYRNLPALFLGTLVDGKLDSRDITAGLLQLAQVGHISIVTKPKEGWLDSVDYCIRLNINHYDLPHGHDFHLLTLLFGSRGAGNEVWLSDLKDNHTQQTKNAATLAMLQKQLRKELVADGYYETTPPTPSVVGLYVVVVGVVVGATIWLVWPPVSFDFFVIAAFMFVSATAWFAKYFGRRRTQLGYEARWHLLGFKQYLSVAEADRISFHNAPSKNPEEFLAWLPYAIAFGVEKEWAAVFADITIPTPSWYGSTDGSQLSAAALTLSVHNFAAEVGGISRAAASAAYGSSGMTGSSGGGFSGGGGGGGGGRSW